MKEMSMWAPRVFSDSGFYLISIFQICCFEKRFKQMSQRFYPQPQLHVGLVIDDFFGSFWLIF